jgi:hypothetical protein
MWKEIVEVMNQQIKLENRRTDLIKCAESVEDIVSYLKEGFA